MDLFNDEYIKFDYDGKTYAIEMLNDPMPSNPRVDAVNIVSLMCWHRRYCLGDHHDIRGHPRMYECLSFQRATFQSSG